MAKIINGLQIAKIIRQEIKAKVQQWVNSGNRAPHLMAIQIGNDPASQSYIENKMKAAQDVGIMSSTKNYEDSLCEDNLLEIIDKLNGDRTVDGILIQLPLPGHMDEKKIANHVCPEKDVDGFSDANLGRLTLNSKTMVPCTAMAVAEILRYSKIDTFGKNAVVVGRSKNVGLPIALLLHSDGRNQTKGLDATVTICHRFTPPESLKQHCLLADIIVSAAGVPNLIKSDMVKPGATIIDVGFTRLLDPQSKQLKMVGDVDFENVEKIAGHLTQVPGGVGPMTITMLLKNTFQAAQKLASLNLR